MNCGEANPMYGKIVSEETRQKISQTSRERWADPEYRQKCIEHLTGENNPFYGKQHSDETRKILSEKAKERYKLYGPSPNRHMTCVVQLSLDGEFIAEYPSMKEAEKITGVTNISNCCRGYYQSAGGFKWMRKKDWEKMQSEI